MLLEDGDPGAQNPQPALTVPGVLPACSSAHEAGDTLVEGVSTDTFRMGCCPSRRFFSWKVIPLVGSSFQNLYYSWKSDIPLQLLKRQELQVSLVFNSPPFPPVSPFLPSCHIPLMMMGGEEQRDCEAEGKGFMREGRVWWATVGRGKGWRAQGKDREQERRNKGQEKDTFCNSLLH